jgi:hypothetical protein
MLLGGAAAAAIATGVQGLPGAAASRRLPARQIDATTLVIADNLKVDWITLDPGWIYEINSQAAMILN